MRMNDKANVVRHSFIFSSELRSALYAPYITYIHQRWEVIVSQSPKEALSRALFSSSG